MKKTPFNFQLKGARKAHHFGGRMLLADDMGLGKTFQSLLYASQIEERPILVICPASVKWHWKREAAWSIGLNGIVLSGRTPFKPSVKLKHKLVIINYDILKNWEAWLIKQKFQVAIIDECHRLGNRSNQWSRATTRICKRIKRILGLSGTPFENRPAEIFTILNILRPDIFKSFFSFGFKFCGPRKRPWGWEFKGAENKKELRELLLTHVMVRRRKKDVLKELPAKTRIVIPLEISSKARKEYQAAEKDFIGWLRKKAPHLAKRAQKAEKLVKFGYLKRLAAELKLPEVLKWMDSFLQDTDKKIILFGIHKSFLTAFKERYGKISTVIDGSVTGKKRQKAIDKFTKNKKIRIMIGNIKAAGHGWNGTAAGAVAMGELWWHMSAMQQAEDRPHRIGQKNAIQSYWLIAQGTIEEDLCLMHQEKQANFDAIIDGEETSKEVNVFDQLEQTILKRRRK